MFVGSNLVLQWVPGRGKFVRRDTKKAPGGVSPGVLQRGVTFALFKSVFRLQLLFIGFKL